MGRHTVRKVLFVAATVAGLMVTGAGTAVADHGDDDFAVSTTGSSSTIAVSIALGQGRSASSSTTTADPAAIRAAPPTDSPAAKCDEAVGAQLAAQVPHVHVHDIRAGVVVVAPDLAQQLLACQHLAGMAQECFGEGELACGEIDGTSANQRTASAQVQL